MNKSILTAFIMLLLVTIFAVADANSGLKLNPISNENINENETIKFNVSVPEHAGTDVIFTINGSNSVQLGTTLATITEINNTLATVAYSPNFNDAGNYVLNISVRNHTNLIGPNTDYKLMTLSVQNVPNPGLDSTPLLSLGSNSLERSNPEHDDRDDREKNITARVAITNDGGSRLTDLQISEISYPLNGISASDLRITPKFPKTTLEVGETIEFDVDIRIPEEMPAVDNEGRETAFRVATINWQAVQDGTTTTVGDSTAIDLQVENQLRIEDIYVWIDNGERESLDDGEDVDEIKPGADVRMVVVVENRYRDRTELAIENVDVEVFNNDNDLDVDEAEDAGDISTESTEEVEFEFSFDDDADDGDYEVEITAKGEDENGALHGARAIITLTIDRESHEIIISNIDVTPEIISCQSTVTLRTTFRNTGKNDEDEVAVSIEAPDLEYGEILTDLDIDEGDDLSRTFTIPVPSRLSNGNHRITVTAYYDNDEESDQEIALLEKRTCQVDEPDDNDNDDSSDNNNDNDNDDVVVVVEPPTNNDDDSTPDTTDEDKDSTEKSDNTIAIALLVLAYIVVLGGGFAVIYRLLKK